VPDRWLVHGDTVQLGALTFDVLHCPGHTPGHVVFFHAPSQVAFVGDVIFAGSIGRTDFPRGNHADLIDAIRHRLFALGDGVRFVPGHGPMSSLGEERRNNPFVSDRAIRGNAG
jgi:glyoxylase-like metal-dependent hydrolase (beta-lactamase superfamily II)